MGQTLIFLDTLSFYRKDAAKMAKLNAILTGAMALSR